MGRLKDLLDAWNDDDYVKVSDPLPENLAKYWRTKQGFVLIETMDFQHLENVVDYFSREGTVVYPTMQPSFENVMLTYLRKQAQINDVHKEIL
jgi:hypothetical protein